MGIDEIDAVDRVRQPMIDNMSNSVTVAKLMRNPDYSAVGSHHNGVKKLHQAQPSIQLVHPSLNGLTSPPLAMAEGRQEAI